jgi:hypothetical protein
MSNKSPDYFARITAISSLLVAIVAIIISFTQQKSAQEIQQKQFNLLQKENLSIQMNPYVDGEIRLTNIKLGPMGYVVQLPWKITISNTGNRNLSILEHLITRGESPESMQYSGIDGGLIENKFTSVVYPFSLEPGVSRTFHVFVGITVPEQIYKTLSSIKEKKNLTDRNVSQIFGRKGIDIYGNKVDYKEFDNKAYHIQIKETEKAQRFWIQFTTGKGNVFLATARKYEPI